jgi:transposase InsO family protein
MSKQNFHQRMNHWLYQKEEQAALIPLIREIREDHPNMSARVMYQKIRPQTMGRDKFEAFCFEHGFKVVCPKNYRKTTDSSGVEHFPNLIEGLEITGVNQVFVSDITYYEMNGRFYYLTLIMDVYNREIVGHSASDNLRTKSTSLPALQMVVNTIGPDPLKGAIFHSDGGGQYYAQEFLKLTSRLEMRNSMAEEVFENSHSERLNGIIKNDYLIGYGPQTLPELRRDLDRAAYHYNTGKPHGSLNGQTPAEYRRSNSGKILKIKQKNKPVEIENNSPSYFPTSTVHHQHQYV